MKHLLDFLELNKTATKIFFIFFSKNNLLLYGLVPEFTPEIPSALNQRVHDLFRFNLGISRQIQLQKVRTETKIFNRQKKSDKKCFFRLRELLAAQRSEAAARCWWRSSTSRFVLQKNQNSDLVLK